MRGITLSHVFLEILGEFSYSERKIVHAMLREIEGTTVPWSITKIAAMTGCAKATVSKTLSKVLAFGAAHRAAGGEFLFNPRHAYRSGHKRLRDLIVEYDLSDIATRPERDRRAAAMSHAQSIRASQMARERGREKSDAEPSKDDVPDLH